jgi:hypothetical protein
MEEPGKPVPINSRRVYTEEPGKPVPINNRRIDTE